jgi:hypothetical protein
MNSARSLLNKIPILGQTPRRLFGKWLLTCLFALFFSPCQASEEYSFDLDEFEKKPLE